MKGANKTDILDKQFGGSPHFANIMNDNATTTSNLGIYQNKTFYTVNNHPKRSGTSMTNYQDDVKRKRVIKKFRGKINLPNTSNSAAAVFHPNRNKFNESAKLRNTTGNKTMAKGHDKIVLPINEVLTQASKFIFTIIFNRNCRKRTDEYLPWC